MSSMDAESNLGFALYQLGRAARREFASQAHRWNPIAAELCLLEWLPRKVVLDPAAAAAVPDALK